MDEEKFLTPKINTVSQKRSNDGNPERKQLINIPSPPPPPSINLNQ